MKKILYIFTVSILGLIFAGFTADDNSDFYKEVEEWHQRRINSLTKETGWLSLAGLYWLKQGKNRFGSAKDNDLIFPEDTPKYMGTFFLKDSVVTISVNNNVFITK